jgi:hypothetical protein
MISPTMLNQEARTILMSRQLENELAYTYIYFFTPPPAAASRRVEA